MILLYEDVYGHKHNKTPNTISVNENTTAFISVISSKSVFRNRTKFRIRKGKLDWKQEKEISSVNDGFRIEVEREKIKTTKKVRKKKGK